MKLKISVFGSGGWGTAISVLLNSNGHDVTLWSAFEDEAARLRQNRENPLLAGVKIPDEIKITSDADEAAKCAELAVMAAPSFAVRSTAEKLKGLLSDGCTVVCISKGIEQTTSMRFSQILEETLGDGVHIASLSGPSHAEEVGRGIPTACVVAAKDQDVALTVQNVFTGPRFRVYTSTDIIGVEMGAAFKNIIALCAGICDGLGMGDNTIAMLMTRGLSEIAELTVDLGGRKETLAGLAGVGDLIVTCTSRHSRNRRAGVLIGKGVEVHEAMRQVGAVVEGYYAASAAHELSQKTGVETPICDEAYKVLYEGKKPTDSLGALMSRTPRPEDSGYGGWSLE
ncbi:MAG: NAD(P)-dependent glycerol-3-phosphate dehydrogenase [Oscillospiraceae bacterium]|nr:NAD(P)-dependent glycerol-3-phosphate dehydrogenase [Oscillospiraceae bacterium]